MRQIKEDFLKIPEIIKEAKVFKGEQIKLI
jgi:hypothetical protein